MSIYERDELGLLVGPRCPHCNAALYLSPEEEAKGRRPICLNACHLPVWQYRIMQEGLPESRVGRRKTEVRTGRRTVQSYRELVAWRGTSRESGVGRRKAEGGRRELT